MKTPLFYLAFIALTLFSFGCGKDKNEDPAPNNSGPSYNSSSDYYWDATIDGSQKVFVRTQNGYMNGAAITGGGYPSSQFGSTYGKYKFTSGQLSLENDNSAIFFNLPFEPTESQYNSFFSNGTKNYGAAEDEYSSVHIYWVDPSGVEWTSYDGSQTGSTFEITNVSDVVDTGKNFKAVTGTFTCKLYNGTSSKTITNGKFRGFFAVYDDAY